MKDIYFQLTVLNAARKHLGCTDMAGKVNIVTCIEIKKHISSSGKYQFLNWTMKMTYIAQVK